MRQTSWCVIAYTDDRPAMISPSMTYADAETLATRWRETLINDRVEIIPAFEGTAIKRQLTNAER